MTRRTRIRSALVFIAPATLVALISCADLFDDPSQCKTDSDCAHFGDAVCDIANSVCIQKTSSKGDDASTEPPADAPTTTVVDAPTETSVPSHCGASPKPKGVIGTTIDAGAGTGPRAEITGSVTLGCDKDWTLDALVFVRSGATLTIEAGTTILAKSAKAGIIVSPGGRIVADGQRDLPIVMTTDSASPVAGDWRGLFVLGLASPAAQGAYDDDPDLAWGGANDQDNSGVLSFVRIEYAKSGLVLAGVGKQTKIDSVEVRRTVDNCFVFYGGTVDAKHLVCQSPGGDQFDWYVGYQGRAQFLFGQKTAAPPVYGANGFVVDDSKPVIYNATVCGDTPTPNGYGIVFRDSTTLDINGAIVTGWFTGVDATGSLAAPGTIQTSIFFGNATNPAYAESSDVTDPDLPSYDDDNGFDELGWIGDTARKNAFTDPLLGDCFDAKSPKPWPKTSLTTNAPKPPSDGFFDPKATFIGAFANSADVWMTGAWVRFDDK